MIADIHKRESFSTIVNYANNQKKKARLIDSRRVDTTSNATIATDMQWQSDQRKNLGKRLVSEPVYHISLDFALEDRPKLNDDLLRQIAREYTMTPVSGESDIQPFQAPTNTPIRKTMSVTRKLRDKDVVEKIDHISDAVECREAEDVLGESPHCSIRTYAFLFCCICSQKRVQISFD